MILVCENFSCQMGYSIHSAVCPWCGTPAYLAQRVPRIVQPLDLEIYRDYFLCKMGHDGDFQLFPGSSPLDVNGIVRALSKSRIITFNGNNFDIPILTYALTGATNEQLKEACDAIIQTGLRSWQFYDRYNLQQLQWLDHIDLIEVAPGQASLKAYGGKMHSRKLQDLPIPPDASIRWCDRVVLREYCGNDLATTIDLRNTLSEQLKLRDDMTAEYGIDLRSKSDAQIAEAILKSTLPFKVERPVIPEGAVIRYVAPSVIAFQTQILRDALELIEASEFVIGSNGSPAMPDALGVLRIRIGESQYQLGMGGLHSCEKSTSRYSTTTHVLRDVDVASFYPNLIRNLELYPKQIGRMFLDIFSGWIDRRLEAKAAGDKVVADSLKTNVNGTFGKLGSKWSILYAPDLMLTVTLTGQLSLLMLIEMLELSDIRVVSANTDGIVINCPREREWLVQEICDWWMKHHNLILESTEYASLHSRDVNSYIALKADGKVKLKGAYAPPKIVGPSWPNPTSEICTDAVVALLRDGTPFETTVRSCQDIRLFVNVRAVKGGGEKDGVYLGKAVRWYYRAGETGAIRYVSNGNMVATSEGGCPVMTLPDTLPDDIDYDRYVSMARDILSEIGVKV